LLEFERVEIVGDCIVAGVFEVWYLISILYTLHLGKAERFKLEGSTIWEEIDNILVGMR
jgi:hypothetical protein